MSDDLRGLAAIAHLAPCPACRSTDVRLSSRGGHARVTCRACGHSGPAAPKPVGAALAWNDHATSDEGSNDADT